MHTTNGTGKPTNLTRLIMQRGKSKGQVARETGMSITHISKVTNGLRMPSVETVMKLATCLDVTTEQIIDSVNQTWRGYEDKWEGKLNAA